ncbi:hypothetical protein PIROE2DRAFT_9340 [Piromyces sp. E2]|nr:hypothetical protein PIROE2DRAFT_9340 [Piromyces sp. E2]|eukprot:OUM64032.1 hypothetical protein PIROE2DRAFT_9340 [Piromyces sp. E2]
MKSKENIGYDVDSEEIKNIPHEKNLQNIFLKILFVSMKINNNEIKSSSFIFNGDDDDMDDDDKNNN